MCVPSSVGIVLIPCRIVACHLRRYIVHEAAIADTANTITALRRYVHALNLSLGVGLHVVDVPTCINGIGAVAVRGILVCFPLPERRHIDSNVCHPFIVTGHEVLNTEHEVAYT